MGWLKKTGRWILAGLGLLLAFVVFGVITAGDKVKLLARSRKRVDELKDGVADLEVDAAVAGARAEEEERRAADHLAAADELARERAALEAPQEKQPDDDDDFARSLNDRWRGR